jgi:hypothetical protein
VLPAAENISGKIVATKVNCSEVETSYIPGKNDRACFLKMVDTKEYKKSLLYISADVHARVFTSAKI